MHPVQLLLVFAAPLSIVLPTANADTLLDTLRRFTRTSCFCGKNECCSKWGYCGTTEAYCGVDCQSGACYAASATADDGSSFELTGEAFACAFPKIDAKKRDRQLRGLREAMELMKWKPTNSSEAAIFLAHVSRETDGLRNLDENCGDHGACSNYQSSWCAVRALPNVKYHGRGWFQLAYPCNYYNAGKALGLDLLKEPGVVSQSEKIAAATAIWYYLETGMDKLAQQGDFGETTRKLSEFECSAKPGYPMQAERVKIYHRMRKCFKLPPATNNLIC